MIVTLVKLLSGAKHSAHVHSITPHYSSSQRTRIGGGGIWDIMDMILKYIGSLYPGLAQHSVGIISTQTTNTVGEDLELADPEQPILL